jgi:hypothetical protein
MREQCPVVGFCGHSNKRSGSIKDSEFLVQLKLSASQGRLFCRELVSRNVLFSLNPDFNYRFDKTRKIGTRLECEMHTLTIKRRRFYAISPPHISPSQLSWVNGALRWSSWLYYFTQNIAVQSSSCPLTSEIPCLNLDPQTVYPETCNSLYLVPQGVIMSYNGHCTHCFTCILWIRK